MTTYRVMVKMGIGIKDAFSTGDGKFYPCTDGIVYVITDKPQMIFEKWGSAVLHVERMGLGVVMG